MPSIVIEVNGSPVSTIDLTALQVFGVSVHGALDRNPKAGLDASGGNYSDGGCGYLIWIANQDLLSTDIVCVRFEAASCRGEQGKTLAELYPDLEPSTETDFTISDEMAAEIRARPRLHQGFIVEASTSGGQQAKAASDDLNTDFNFSLLWDNSRPDHARVRLSTYCLDDVLARTGGNEQLQTTLSPGESVVFSLLP